MIFLCIFPFIINGHYWFDSKCRFASDTEQCSEFQFAHTLISSIVNIFFGTMSFILIVISVLYSRKQYTSSTPTPAKIERRLVLQSFISSIFLILLTITVLISIQIPFDLRTSLILANLANLLFCLHHYPGMIVLFFVSPVFRQRFLEFYKINPVLKFIMLKRSTVGSQNISSSVRVLR